MAGVGQSRGRFARVYKYLKPVTRPMQQIKPASTQARRERLDNGKCRADRDCRVEGISSLRKDFAASLGGKRVCGCNRALILSRKYN
jgi:hypothetical protein